MGKFIQFYSVWYKIIRKIYVSLQLTNKINDISLIIYQYDEHTNVIIKIMRILIIRVFV